MPTGPVVRIIEAGEDLYKAAKVIVLTCGTRAHLEQHDPRALEQLNNAMDAWEGASPLTPDEEVSRRRNEKIRKSPATPDSHPDWEPDDDVKEVAQELEDVAREVIEHLSKLWWAFDSKDHRAIMVRKVALAYRARRRRDLRDPQPAPDGFGERRAEGQTGTS
jgi:hypothetical protein